MKKICIICKKEWNDWFMRVLNWLFRDTHDFKTCQTCRDMTAIGWSVAEIRRMSK